jgi:hypothetical protein
MAARSGEHRLPYPAQRATGKKAEIESHTGLIQEPAPAQIIDKESGKLDLCRSGAFGLWCRPGRVVQGGMEKEVAPLTEASKVVQILVSEPFVGAVVSL